MTPGIKTTEFWTMVVVTLLSALVAMKVLPADTDVQASAGVLVGAAPIVYIIARAILKAVQAAIAADKNPQGN